MPSTALIVGAGIGGLAAGIALRRVGWKVRVLERAPTPRELGFGLLLAPNALAALAELGLAEPVMAAGAPAGRVEIRRIDGATIRRLDAQLGGPAIVALRSVLHTSLIAALGDDVLTLSAEASGFRESAHGVTLMLADGGSVDGTVLIGADGVQSVIRRQLHPEEPPPIASGYCAIRGVAGGAAPLLGSLSAALYLDDGIEAATVRAGSDAVYWYVSLLSADVTGTSPREILQRPLRAAAPSLRAIVDATLPEDVRFDPLFRRDPLAIWGTGRVTLLGDAAHPVLPHTGQGAAQALEDAVALGLALRHGDPVTDLRRYERLRQRRTDAFVRLGPRLARITTTHSRGMRALRTAALTLLPARVLARPAVALGRDPHRELRQLAATAPAPLAPPAAARKPPV